MSKKIYVPKRYFDGEQFVSEHAVLTDFGKVEKIIPKNDLPSSIEKVELAASIVAPAYKDLQINGSYGKMFSLEPTVETLQAIDKYSRAGGATGFLATVPTIEQEQLVKAVNAAHTYWWRGYKGLWGLHLEGPFINPLKKGAHKESLIRKPDLPSLKDFIAWSDFAIRMTTLAPEQCSDEVISYLAGQNIVVSAGHSNATYEEAVHGFSKGVTTATHLYNAMSPFQHRDPGLVGAVFDKEVYSGIIPDGIHVNEAAFRIAHKILKDRLFLVTDAMTALKRPGFEFIFTGDRYEKPDGTLAGSCLTMETAVRKAMEMGLTPEESLKAASLIPCKVMGRAEEMGRIAPGYKIDWVVLDEEFKVQKVIVE